MLQPYPTRRGCRTAEGVNLGSGDAVPTRLASIERSIADLRLAITKDFATKAGLDRLESRVAVAEQRLTVLAEWRSNLERRAESAECVRAQAGGE